MTPVGKIVKLLLALIAAGVIAAGLVGCQKDAAPAQPEAPKAAAPKTEPAKTETAKPAAPADSNAARKVEIRVTEEGYEPSPITLKKGEPVELTVTRTTDATCATEFVLDEHKIDQKLPLNEAVTIRFTPNESGELKYGCAMGKMISGRFKVE